MPSSSKKQHNFMAAIAHSPSFAKKVGVPQSVGKDFNDADKGKKMKANPMNPKNPPSAAKAIKIPKSSGNRADLQKVNNPKTNQGSAELFKKGGDTMASKKLPPFMGKETKAEEAKEMKIKAVSPKMYQKGEKAEGIHKMAKGGMPAALAKHAAKPASKAHAGLKAGGMTKMGAVKTSPKPDGIAKRGMTKGTQVTMKKGGKC
jgi:hypothetical protein